MGFVTYACTGGLEGLMNYKRIGNLKGFVTHDWIGNFQWLVNHEGYVHLQWHGARLRSLWNYKDARRDDGPKCESHQPEKEKNWANGRQKD